MTDHTPTCRNRGCPRPTAAGRLICQDCADERYRRYRGRTSEKSGGLDEETVTDEVEK